MVKPPFSPSIILSMNFLYTSPGSPGAVPAARIDLRSRQSFQGFQAHPPAIYGAALVPPLFCLSVQRQFRKQLHFNPPAPIRSETALFQFMESIGNSGLHGPFTFKNYRLFLKFSLAEEITGYFSRFGTVQAGSRPACLPFLWGRCRGSGPASASSPGLPVFWSFPAAAVLLNRSPLPSIVT